LKSSTNSYTLITLVNYDKNQSALYKNNNLTANHQQKTNKPPTITKKRNNLINKTIEYRLEVFKKDVFKNTHYTNKILNDFFNYWSELNNEKTKMKFETKGGFFEIEKRLHKWNERQWSAPQKKILNFNNTSSNR